MPLGLSPAFYVVAAHAAGAVLLAWAYFRRCRIARPPIGVLALGDVAAMLCAIVLVPLLYLTLPMGLVAGLLAVGTLSLLHAAGEPLLPARALWPAIVLLLAADFWAALAPGPTGEPTGPGTAGLAFFAINNAVLAAAAVGAANLWAQSGMKARDAAVLAGALAAYDYVSTVHLTMMADLLARLAGRPLVPVLAWPSGGEGQWLGIGLGDVLLASIFPLVMRKAFGRTAGLTGAALSLAAVGGMLALLDLGLVRATIPAMCALGPLMVAQYGYWIRRRGAERTTRQFLEDSLSESGLSGSATAAGAR